MSRIHMRVDRDRSAGQALVETALVLPIFFLIVFGIIDGGRAILAYNTASQATRNVARVASVTCFDTSPRCDSGTAGAPVKDAIDSQNAGIQGPVTWTVQCINPTTNAVANPCQVGFIVRVKAATQVTLFTPIIAQAFGIVDVDSTSEQTIIQ